jgi:hypothetical protein
VGASVVGAKQNPKETIMKKISIIALIAALSVATAAVGAGVTTNAGSTVNSTTNAATGSSNAGANGNANGGANAQVTANSSSVGLDVNASASGEADTSTSVSAPDASSMLSPDSSMSSMTSSEVSQACADLNGAGMTTTAIDAAALATVQNVTVFSVSDCSGLGDSAALDATTNASLAGNANVAAAIQTSGYAGQQVVGYTLDGTSLTVFLKKN